MSDTQNNKPIPDRKQRNMMEFGIQVYQITIAGSSFLSHSVLLLFVATIYLG